MKIAFFGQSKTFDYYQIGGTDSIVRRLANILCQKGHEIELIQYRCQQEKTITLNNEKNDETLTKESTKPNNPLTLKYFSNFKDACSSLRDFDHVVSIYINRKDRLSYYRFRKKHRLSTTFHHLYTVWPESLLKRRLITLEASTLPFDGCSFCISPRIHKVISKHTRNSHLLLPPVDHHYFKKPGQIQNNKKGKINIAFAGRLDSSKGIENVIKLFGKLDPKKYNCSINGFVWPHKPQTIQWQNLLHNQNKIKYIPAEFAKWSNNLEKNFAEFLNRTDILILPYKKLSSTIDTPLLILEAMASLCCIIAPSLGNIKHIYPDPNHLINNKWDNTVAAKLIDTLAGKLDEDKHKIYQQNQKLQFDTDKISEIFIANLEKFQK